MELFQAMGLSENKTDKIFITKSVTKSTWMQIPQKNSAKSKVTKIDKTD